ncbi:MAG: hypothetical protein LBK00_01120 [Treponema sp.]|jgi:hypothetical protein|nr:hypothetical protein [Treponema sp.]
MDVEVISWGLDKMFSGLGIIGIAIAIYKRLKHNAEVKKLEEQRRIKELEVENQNNRP